MIEVDGAAQFPTLFVHAQRADWGVSVLSGENDGKRRYLFEGGEERTMGQGALDLMHKVEQPDRHQRATYARLVALLAKRKTHTVPSATRAAQSPVAKQLANFHAKYSGGLHAAAWQGESQNLPARQKRAASAKRMREQLSATALDKLAAAQRLDAIWNQGLALLSDSELGAELPDAPATSNQQRTLGAAVHELLHGSDGYERRFDQFIASYESAFGKPPSWQTATVLPALMFPTSHVYVEPNTFRKQLKALSQLSALAARPNGVTYARCLNMARTLANQLAAHGEVPRDLLDVYDFMRSTVATSTKS